MRRHSLIALLVVVCGIVTLNLSAAAHRQDEPTNKPSLPKIGTERPELSLHLLSGGPDLSGRPWKDKLWSWISGPPGVLRALTQFLT